MPHGPHLQIGQLCARLGVPVRQARYLLEQGFVPKGVDPDPDRGNHRQLDPAQAFWLAVVLKLKQAGLGAPLAARIADLAEASFRPVAAELARNPTYHPARFVSPGDARWAVEVGDLAYARTSYQTNTTISLPLDPRNLTRNPWTDVNTGEPRPDAHPIVVIRIDLTELAERLRPAVWDGSRDADGR